MTVSFSHISDPHLSTLSDVPARRFRRKRFLSYLSWRRKRRLEHRREVLDALASDLAAEATDLLLVTGDLTHTGLPEEFEQSRRWLESLGTPAEIALVAGNHDALVTEDWSRTFALWAEYMAGDNGCGESMDTLFPSLRRRGNISFIGLNTACPTAPLLASGRLGGQQLARLPALLDDARARGDFRVVYLHHCPLPGEEKRRKHLSDAASLCDIIAAHGAELLLHGHGHRGQVRELATREGIAPVIAVPSASALGMHGKDSAAWNRYEVSPAPCGWKLVVRQRHLEPADRGFTTGETREFELRRSSPPLSQSSP